MILKLRGNGNKVRGAYCFANLEVIRGGRLCLKTSFCPGKGTFFHPPLLFFEMELELLANGEKSVLDAEDLGRVSLDIHTAHGESEGGRGDSGAGDDDDDLDLDDLVASGPAGSATHGRHSNRSRKTMYSGVVVGSSPPAVTDAQPSTPANGNIDDGPLSPSLRGFQQSHQPRGYRELQLDDDDADSEFTLLPERVSQSAKPQASSRTSSLFTSFWASAKAPASTSLDSASKIFQPKLGSTGDALSESVLSTTVANGATSPSSPRLTPLTLGPNTSFTIPRPQIASPTVSRHSTSSQASSASGRIGAVSGATTSSNNAAPPSSAPVAPIGAGFPGPTSSTTPHISLATGGSQRLHFERGTRMLAPDDGVEDLQQQRQPRTAFSYVTPAAGPASAPHQLAGTSAMDIASANANAAPSVTSAWNGAAQHRPVVPMNADDDDDGGSTTTGGRLSGGGANGMVGAGGEHGVMGADDDPWSVVPRVIANMTITTAKNLCSADCSIQ
ncbi:hypothetical protein DFJ73DRAFT_827736 [Zopfochytrium polystomum]|nr:hypothetical protein DFJ73DRAFT_827736 [Zopfochytrium polystomum]